MKIVVEVELEQHEVPLAQELLNTIRALTDHVKSNNQPVLSVNVKGAADTAASAAKAAAPTPKAAPATPAVAQTLPPGQKPAEVLYGLISRLADPSRLDEVAQGVAFVLNNSGGDEKALLEDLLAALMQAAFDPANIAAQRRAEPYLRIMPLLPDNYKNQFRDEFTKRVLSHLTKKRPPTCNREEFYLQAEAFAVLVDMAMVQMDGALQTIIRLLKKPEAKAAAITMLGQTLDKCLDKVRSCNQSHVAALQALLAGVHEPQFAPDLTWINNNLIKAGAPPLPAPAAAPVPQPVPQAIPTPTPVPQPIPTPAPAAAAPPQPQPQQQQQQPQQAQQAPPAAAAAGGGPAPGAVAPGTLSLTSSFSGGEGSIFALAYEPGKGQVIAGGKDVELTVWSGNGQLVHRMPTPGMYVCGIDINPRQQLMTWCGVYDPASPVRTRISMHSLDPAFTPIADITRPEVDMVTCVRSLPEVGGLISGETIKDAAAGGAFKELLRYYDINTVVQQKGGAVEPVNSFAGHTALVTCVAPLHTQPQAFLSGSRDETVRLWDIRMAEQAGHLVTKHHQMVTSMDTNEHLLTTASLDQNVFVFDLRMLGQGAQTNPVMAASWMNGGVLKVALAGAPGPATAAVATVQGLFLVDFARISGPNNMPTILPATATRGGQLKQYNDIKWATGTRTLFAAASDSARIDTFELAV